MSTEDDVRRPCLALPGVTERPGWQRPAWFAWFARFGKALLARIRVEGVLTVKSDEREAHAAMEPDIRFRTPHHGRPPLPVPVRLERVDPVGLAELLAESHRLAGGTR